MALVACHQCGKTVSTYDAACSACGAVDIGKSPSSPRKSLFGDYKTQWIIVGIVIAVAAVLQVQSTLARRTSAEQRVADRAAVPAPAPEWQPSEKLLAMASQFVRMQGLYCPQAHTMKEDPFKSSANYSAFRLGCDGHRGEQWYLLTLDSNYRPIDLKEL